MDFLLCCKSRQNKDGNVLTRDNSGEQLINLIENETSLSPEESPDASEDEEIEDPNGTGLLEKISSVEAIVTNELKRIQLSRDTARYTPQTETKSETGQDVHLDVTLDTNLDQPTSRPSSRREERKQRMLAEKKNSEAQSILNDEAGRGKELEKATLGFVMKTDERADRIPFFQSQFPRDSEFGKEQPSTHKAELMQMKDEMEETKQKILDAPGYTSSTRSKQTQVIQSVLGEQVMKDSFSAEAFLESSAQIDEKRMDTEVTEVTKVTLKLPKQVAENAAVLGTKDITESPRKPLTTGCYASKSEMARHLIEGVKPIPLCLEVRSDSALESRNSEKIRNQGDQETQENRVKAEDKEELGKRFSHGDVDPRAFGTAEAAEPQRVNIFKRELSSTNSLLKDSTASIETLPSELFLESLEEDGTLEEKTDTLATATSAAPPCPDCESVQSNCLDASCQDLDESEEAQLARYFQLRKESKAEEDQMNEEEMGSISESLPSRSSNGESHTSDTYSEDLEEFGRVCRSLKDFEESASDLELSDLTKSSLVPSDLAPPMQQEDGNQMQTQEMKEKVACAEALETATEFSVDVKTSYVEIKRQSDGESDT